MEYLLLVPSSVLILWVFARAARRMALSRSSNFVLYTATAVLTQHALIGLWVYHAELPMLLAPGVAGLALFGWRKIRESCDRRRASRSYSGIYFC